MAPFSTMYPRPLPFLKRVQPSKVLPSKSDTKPGSGEGDGDCQANAPAVTADNTRREPANLFIDVDFSSGKLAVEAFRNTYQLG